MKQRSLSEESALGCPRRLRWQLSSWRPEDLPHYQVLEEDGLPKSSLRCETSRILSPISLDKRDGTLEIGGMGLPGSGPRFETSQWRPNSLKNGKEGWATCGWNREVNVSQDLASDPGCPHGESLISWVHVGRWWFVAQAIDGDPGNVDPAGGAGSPHQVVLCTCPGRQDVSVRRRILAPSAATSCVSLCRLLVPEASSFSTGLQRCSACL